LVRLRRVGPHMRGHCYDAFVGLAGRDKSLPRLTMAMLRLNAFDRQRGRHRVRPADFGEICKRTPYIGDLKPGGRYVMKDLHDVGGVPVLMKKPLLDGGYLHGDCMTVTGKTIAENLKGVVFPTEQDVVHPTARPAGADRRARRAQGQPGSTGCHREGRRDETAALRRTGIVLRH
jgi:dihydroxyacid dehydratase/phosphogluconate dehydratase